MVLKFLKDIFIERKLVMELAKNDCKARYASSALGVVWAFLQPLTTIFIFWLVFQMGFKNGPIDGIPFVLWYIPAYLCYTFFNEALSQSTNSVIEYAYLVKKVNFKVTIIPAIKVISAGLIHMGFIAFIFFMCIVYQEPITLHSIQIIYYFTGMVLFLLGISWLCAAANVFVRDTSGIVNVVLQIAFWASPIIWNARQIHPIVLQILKLNPLLFFCEGYRNCFVYHQWFWEDWGYNIYFWVITLLVLWYGSKSYYKLSPYFDDVL
ncbi:MAG: ABC transporter permease [Eubacteriales bacterium]|nr:ABC transporter permease [Eubacteriales bacterium]